MQIRYSISSIIGGSRHKVPWLNLIGPSLKVIWFITVQIDSRSAACGAKTHLGKKYDRVQQMI